MAYFAGMSPAPAAIIHTGDLTHNAKPEQYALARPLLTDLAVPLIAVPGNRDSRRLFAQNVPCPVEISGDFIQFALDLGPLRVLALDTIDDGRGLGAYCEARFAELSRFLADGDGRPTIVAMHHPPLHLASVPGGLQFRSAETAHRLAVELARDANVIAVLAGHVHRRMTVPIGRASLETMPSLAVDLRRGVYARHYHDRPIVLVHEVIGNRIETRSVALDKV